tara:strand:- start:1687 stop:1902 length:216 start_codon:yes stop_codon:yes gene_type:complete
MDKGWLRYPMPKIKRPRNGWWRPEKKRFFRRKKKIQASEKGLPPCPSCGEWTMQRDNTRNEIYCGICGAVI